MRSLALLLVLGAWAPIAGHAHEVRPAYLEITEDAKHRYGVLWKQPVMGEIAVHLRPQLSTGWLDGPATRVESEAGYLSTRWLRIQGGPLSLEGQTLRIEGLDQTITDVLVNIELADGQRIHQVLRPQSASLLIRTQAAAVPPVAAYLRLGIEHILSGYDHLAFVLGLMLLVKSRTQLFKTITAFTAAHSLTLAAATLHWVQVRPPVIEALVALSIVFLATELARVHRTGTDRAAATLAVRLPWLVAFTFGLLHGFAFAGALRDVGLPRNDIPLALLLFNAGVEAGQLIFVVLVSVAVAALERLVRSRPEWIGRLPPYAIGSLASFWLIDRLLVITQLNH